MRQKLSKLNTIALNYKVKLMGNNHHIRQITLKSCFKLTSKYQICKFFQSQIICKIYNIHQILFLDDRQFLDNIRMKSDNKNSFKKEFFIIFQQMHISINAISL